MKKEELIDLIGEIDERYIIDAERTPVTCRVHISVISAAAACLLVLIIAAILVPQLLKPDDTTPTNIPSYGGEVQPDSIEQVFFHQGVAYYETVEGEIYVCTEDGSAYKIDMPLADIYYAEGGKLICRNSEGRGLVLFDLDSGGSQVLQGTESDSVTSACLYLGRLYYTCSEPLGGKLKSISLTDYREVREELPSQIIIKVTQSDRGVVCVTGKLETTYTLREDIGLLESNFTMLTGVALLDGSGELHTLLEPSDMGYTHPDSCLIAVEGGRYIFAVIGRVGDAVWGVIE